MEKREPEKEQLKNELETLKKRFENERSNLHYPGWHDKFPYPPKKDTHGTIEVFFKRLVGYHRFIEVEKGQQNSIGYKVDGDGKTEAVHVNDAKCPPDERTITGKGMLDILLNRDN